MQFTSIGRIMRLMGLEAIYPKQRLSIPVGGDKKYPYLLRNLKIDRPDQVWCADITYIRMLQGFVYLVAIMDWYSRYVLAWDGLKRLKSKFTPRFSKFKDKDCRHVPVDKYAETKTQNILKRYNGPLQWTSPRQRDLPRSLRRTEGRSRIRTSLHRSSILLWISW